MTDAKRGKTALHRKVKKKFPTMQNEYELEMRSEELGILL